MGPCRICANAVREQSRDGAAALVVVGVQVRARRLDRGVTQQLPQRLEVDAGAQRVGGERVPERVRTAPCDPGPQSQGSCRLGREGHL